MIFNVINWNSSIPTSGRNTVYLKADNWNDYSFVTLFRVSLYDEDGVLHDIGSVKIGFIGQTEEVSTQSKLDARFECLQDAFFSLGTDVGYYQTLCDELSDEFVKEFLCSLRDIVFDKIILDNIKEEKVFKTSLLRWSSVSVIKGQYRRVLVGEAPLTDFSFCYARPEEENFAGVSLGFEVIASSKPSTNIHAIIGRNGAGKTSLLNGMIEAIVAKTESNGCFYDTQKIFGGEIDEDYFSSLISVSFSPFDRFAPPPDQPDPARGTCYYYIGLKNSDSGDSVTLKTLFDLYSEFQEALSLCFLDKNKKERWEKALSTLESDNNFAMMDLASLANFSGEELAERAIEKIRLMSSGHAVVLLTMTKLVATVEEKSLILIDEPESHLHPPLLSAFTRALNQLLFDRNGVAIVATHSPVVLQEIPKSCVNIITRENLAVSISKPEIETFGENVGTLTREVFGLEVVRSGFHTVLKEAVQKGHSYEDILQEYDGQIGYEAKAILKVMIQKRDRVKD